MNTEKYYKKLLMEEPKPIKLGNTNKSGKCGMCGVSVKKLYPRKVGKTDFMICERCKDIMDFRGVNEMEKNTFKSCRKKQKFVLHRLI